MRVSPELSAGFADPLGQMQFDQDDDVDRFAADSIPTEVRNRKNYALSPSPRAAKKSRLTSDAQMAVSQTSKDDPLQTVNSFTEVRSLAAVEKAAIEHAIAACDENVVKAASLLEVSPSTLYRKMQQW